MVMATDDHYTIISADCHAGANHETYRSYLEAKYVDDFDALEPLARESGPTVGELAQPLTDLPEEPNEALLKGRRRAS